MKVVPASWILPPLTDLLLFSPLRGSNGHAAATSSEVHSRQKEKKKKRFHFQKNTVIIQNTCFPPTDSGVLSTQKTVSKIVARMLICQQPLEADFGVSVG